MNEYRFQWSLKLDNGEIFVVHENDFNVLKANIDIVKIYIKNQNRGEINEEEFYSKGEVEVALDKEKDFEEEMDELDESMCTIHKVKMKERDGKNGKFYSHSRGEYPNLEWCSGRGFPNEK